MSEPVDLTVLTLFTSPNCGACKDLKPDLQAVAAEMGLTIVEVNTAEPEVLERARKLGLRRVPAVVAADDRLLFSGQIDRPSIAHTFRFAGLAPYTDVA